jgi:hypothetical protein
MGLRLIHGYEEGNYNQPCEVLYCSTSGVAFGPVMRSGDGEPFVQFAEDNGHNLRQMKPYEVCQLYTEWRKLTAPATKER